jgi:PAS domain S-box-containing protein
MFDFTDSDPFAPVIHPSVDNLEAFLAGVTDPVTVRDAAGHLVYANEAAATALGFSSATALLEAPPHELAARVQMWDEQGRPLASESSPLQETLNAHASGERTIRLVMNGSERWLSVTAWPVKDPDGTGRYAVNIFRDVTERKHREEALHKRVAFLSQAGDVLGSSLDFETTAKNVAGLVVPQFADWCIVYVVQRDSSIRRLAVEHNDPSVAEVARQIREEFVLNLAAPEGVSKVLRTGKPELHPEAPPSLLAADVYDSARLEELLRPIGIRSWMCVPLISRARILGAISFFTAESGRTYGPEDLALAEDLARRASTAVDNARLYEERSHIARTLQHSLLPPQLPDIEGIEIAARYRPTGEGNEVGGDFYDLFETAEGDWAIVIGDVCGKGADAAALTGLSRHTIRTAAMQERHPSRVLTMLNDAIVLQNTGRFCTVAYGRLEPAGNRAAGRLRGDRLEAGMLGQLLRAQLVPESWIAPHAKLTVSCGGHPLPLVLRSGGPVVAVGRPGTLLGIYPDPQLTDHEIYLGMGDAVVLYTDGVSEEPIPSVDGEEGRLAAVLRQCIGMDANAMAERIERAAVEWQRGGARDDMAILVVRIVP